MQKIGVEKTLTPVKEYLTEMGYEVDSIDTSPASVRNGNYDAYIISGMQTDLMDIQDTATKSPIIDASGLSAEEVYDELQHRLLKQ